MKAFVEIDGTAVRGSQLNLNVGESLIVFRALRQYMEDRDNPELDRKMASVMVSELNKVFRKEN